MNWQQAKIIANFAKEVNTYRNALMKDVRNILILGIFHFILKVCFIKLMWNRSKQWFILAISAIL